MTNRGNLVAQLKNERQKYACLLEADESMRKRMEGSPHKNHEDHIAGKGMNESLQFGAQIHSHATSYKQYQMRKQQWRKNGKTGENRGMAADESQKQERGDR